VLANSSASPTIQPIPLAAYLGKCLGVELTTEAGKNVTQIVPCGIENTNELISGVIAIGAERLSRPSQPTERAVTEDSGTHRRWCTKHLTQLK
jgi:hypothetical protein